jgi:hypothetical protein
MSRVVKPQTPNKASTAPLFPPSWLDRLQAWVEDLPVPPWASYLLAALGVSVLLHFQLWLDGSLPPGSIEVAQLVAALFLVYFVALIHYLNTTARGALANYRPLLDVEDREYATLEYTLTRIPRRVGLIATFLGSVIGAANFFSSPESWGVTSNSSVLATASTLIQAMVVYVGVTYWGVQVIRQARTVDRIHRMTTRLNIFRRDPVYAFSALTLRSAIGLLLFAYSYPILAFYVGLPPLSAIDVAALGAAIAMSLAIFILPLSRMHRLLAGEKRRLLLDADGRYSLLIDRFNRQLDKGKYTELESTGRAIATLATQSDSLAKVSTWPWRPETLRSLLSTIAVPIILYLASRFLGRLVGI